MHNRRDFLMGLGSAAAGLAVFGWARPSWAPVCVGCVTTSVMLRFSAVFFFPPQPVFQGEEVALSGNIHAVAIVTPGATMWTADYHLNMADVEGLGQTTGNLYIANGAQKFIGIQFVPPDPIYPPTPCFPVFSLQPTNGLADVPLPVTFQPFFDAAGNLLASSTVTLTVT